MVRWPRRASTRDFWPALAALFGPVQIFFSSLDTVFTSFVPIAQQAGQAVVPCRLSLNTCLWGHHMESVGISGFFFIEIKDKLGNPSTFCELLKPNVQRMAYKRKEKHR